jgi:hypothetical protein
MLRKQTERRDPVVQFDLKRAARRHDFAVLAGDLKHFRDLQLLNGELSRKRPAQPIY